MDSAVSAARLARPPERFRTEGRVSILTENGFVVPFAGMRKRPMHESDLG